MSFGGLFLPNCTFTSSSSGSGNDARSSSSRNVARSTDYQRCHLHAWHCRNNLKLSFIDASKNGSKEEAGEREFAAAAGAGYRTCVTTRSANIFASHRDHLACLPRNPISGQREGQDVRLLGLWTSGAIPALKNRFRQVVTT